MVYSIGYPLLYLISKRSLIVKTEFLWLIIFSFLWVLYFIFWCSMNIKSIAFDLSGPNVEMFTPLLYLTNVFAFTMVSRLSNSFLDYSIRKFLKIYFLLLVVECLYRYYLEPHCFLNYSCRFDAKVIGFHSTTNALGLSLIVIISSLLLASSRSLYKVAFPIILVTTMARAAIIAQLIGYGIRAYLKLGVFVRFVFIGALLFFISYIYSINPLGIFSDGSLLSKFDFFSAAFNIVPNSSIDQLLLGYGANFAVVTEIVGVNGWSPHAPILKAFFYFGLVGVFLYFASFLCLARLRPGMWFVSLIYLICSMAGAPIYFPTLIPAFLILRYLKPHEGRYA